MDHLEFSRHAEWRMANRGFSREHVALLVKYGRRRRARGATVYFMDKKARSRVRTAIGPKPYAKVEKKLDGYVVVTDGGTVVTAAKRLRRFHD